MAWIELHRFPDDEPVMVNPNNIGAFWRITTKDGYIVTNVFMDKGYHIIATEDYETVDELIRIAVEGVKA